MSSKGISLNINARYNPQKDEYYLTSRDEQLEGKPFYLTVRQGSETEQTLESAFAAQQKKNEEQNLLSRIPLIARTPLAAYHKNPLKIPIGLGLDGREEVIDFSNPHRYGNDLLIVGSERRELMNEIQSSPHTKHLSFLDVSELAYVRFSKIPDLLSRTVNSAQGVPVLVINSIGSIGHIQACNVIITEAVAMGVPVIMLAPDSTGISLPNIQHIVTGADLVQQLLPEGVKTRKGLVSYTKQFGVRAPRFIQTFHDN